MQSSKIINNKIFTRLVIVLASVQLISILLSFLILIYLFLISDFNFDLVYFNSHSEKPLIYKFSGVWGNHEGSMLLWILILVLFTLYLRSRKEFLKDSKISQLRTEYYDLWICRIFIFFIKSICIKSEQFF